MKTRAERAAALAEKCGNTRPYFNKLTTSLGIIRKQSEFIRDAIHLIQTPLGFEIIFISGIKALIDFSIRYEMLERCPRNQDDHQNQVKEIFLFAVAAHNAA
jgi:hypothetical protein